MKNKKAFEWGLETIMKLVLVLLVAGLIILGPIRGWLAGKQFPFFEGEIEGGTSDCDEDEVIGLSDQCPCDPDTQKLAKDERCGEPASRATENCPVKCKKTT